MESIGFVRRYTPNQLPLHSHTIIVIGRVLAKSTITSSALMQMTTQDITITVSSLPTGSSAFQRHIPPRERLALDHANQQCVPAKYGQQGNNVFTNLHHMKLNVQLR